jgi:glycosyltransferase involved in cell wall biosynthesis
MSVLDGEAYLRPAVESILNQTFGDFEFIVIDNASTDATPGILDSYNDPRLVRLRNDKVLSLTQSLNIGLQKAEGMYIARQDADDISAPSRFQLQSAFLDAHADAILVGGHVRLIDETSAVFGHFTPPIEPHALYEALAWSNPFAHSVCMFRRDAAITAGGYPANYIFAQDLALWLKLARRGTLGMIGQNLLDLREHRGQTTNAPSYRIVRHKEAIDLFLQAQDLPGLSDEARSRGRVHLANLRGQLARDYLKSGSAFAAAAELARSFFTAPGFFVRRVFGGPHASALLRH